MVALPRSVRSIALNTFNIYYKNTKKRISTVQKIILLLVVMSSTLCVGVVAPILPSLSKNYSTTENAVLWIRLITIIPHLIIGILSIPVGFILHKIDRVQTLTIAILVFTLAGISCFTAKSIIVLVILRAILGFCTAIFLSCAFTLISDIPDKKERIATLSLQVTFISIGTICCNFLSGAVADTFNWRYSFFIYAIPSLLVPFVWTNFRDSTDSHAKQSRRTVNVLDIIRTTLFKSRKRIEKKIIVVTCVLGFINMMMYYSIPLQMPFLLASITGMTATKISLTLVIETVSAAFFAFVYAFIRTDTINTKHIVAIGFCIMGTAFYMISKSHSYIFITSMSALYGMGFAMVIPNLNIWLAQNTTIKNRNIVFGFYQTGLYTGKFSSAIWIHTQYNVADKLGSVYKTSAMLLFITSISVLLFVNKVIDQKR